jgi:hypothetical protein
MCRPNHFRGKGTCKVTNEMFRRRWEDDDELDLTEVGCVMD